MIDTPQTLPAPQWDVDIEKYYKEAKKRIITVGNIRETERGVFVQFTPRVGKGKDGTEHSGISKLSLIFWKRKATG